MGVFVSYSSRDKDAVKSLSQDLQDAGEQVWLDQRLGGGDAWWRAILEQIRGCEVFVFALSQNSIQSKPCQAELRYAQDLGLPILPVQVGLVDSMQLNPLATVQTLDYRNPTPKAGMQVITALNRARAQRQPLPSPLPGEPLVPFEYLIRLYHTISSPNYLSPPEQAALVAQLQLGLREDGEHDAARKDIAMLLNKLRDREDVTYRTRTEVDTVLAAIDSDSHPESDSQPRNLTAGDVAGTPHISTSSPLPHDSQDTSVKVDATTGIPEPRIDTTPHLGTTAEKLTVSPQKKERTARPDRSAAATKRTSVRLKVPGGLIVGYAAVSLVFFVAAEAALSGDRYWSVWYPFRLFWANPWLAPVALNIEWGILGLALALATNILTHVASGKPIITTGRVASIVIILAACVGLLAMLSSPSYWYDHFTAWRCLSVPIYLAIIAFGLAALPLHQRWSWPIVALGTVGLAYQLVSFAVHTDFAWKLSAFVYVAWLVLMLFAGVFMYRDEIVSSDDSQLDV